MELNIAGWFIVGVVFGYLLRPIFVISDKWVDNTVKNYANKS